MDDFVPATLEPKGYLSQYLYLCRQRFSSLPSVAERLGKGDAATAQRRIFLFSIEAYRHEIIRPYMVLAYPPGYTFERVSAEPGHMLGMLPLVVYVTDGVRHEGEDSTIDWLNFLDSLVGDIFSQQQRQPVDDEFQIIDRLTFDAELASRTDPREGVEQFWQSRFTIEYGN